jgi:hypothetical protein
MKEVIIICLIATFIGGTANTLNRARELRDLKRKNKKTNVATLEFLDTLTIFFSSFVASALVPSVSGLLSSAVLIEVSHEWTKQLVLFGICLAAALLGERFTNPLLNRLQAQVKQLEQNQSNLIEAVSESSSTESSALKMINETAQMSEIDIKKQEVLKAIAQGKKNLRSFQGIEQTVTLPSEELKDVLGSLVNEGKIGVQDGIDGEPRWFLKI